jgi:hypothetical protein
MANHPVSIRFIAGDQAHRFSILPPKSDGRIRAGHIGIWWI